MLNRLFIHLIIVLVSADLSACSTTNVGSANNSTDRKSTVVENVSGSPVNVRAPGANLERQTAENSFRSVLKLHGIEFLIESPNRLVGNTVTVTPSGLKVSNDEFTSPANGEVVDAKIGDLNTDRSPEVYVFIRDRSGSGRINVVAYGTNAKKSMSEFILPEPDPRSKEYLGYYGNDEFEIVENVLSRRFPLFRKDGTEMKRTGKVRIIQYKIKPGEATWQFYTHRFDEF